MAPLSAVSIVSVPEAGAAPYRTTSSANSLHTASRHTASPHSGSRGEAAQPPVVPAAPGRRSYPPLPEAAVNLLLDRVTPRSRPPAPTALAPASAPALPARRAAGQAPGRSRSIGRHNSYDFRSTGARPAAPAQPARSYLGAFLVTCYDLTGTTASGELAGLQSVAVDPRVIPLGTEIYVQGVGDRTADDTGGAIIGNHIDIWEPTYTACADWGVQERAIYTVERSAAPVVPSAGGSRQPLDGGVNA